ncbi:MAG TPA: Crp/Fnr family transcriptional regulator [Polyangiaceae bacterium]|nr:Crp/Fnr family transcriptional regulator [Polyangiaceae bacterium]
MSLLNILHKTPSLAGVDPAELAKMANAASVRTLQRGAFVWRAGDSPQSLTIIRSGLVKISREAVNGRVHLCGLFGAPESIGDVVLLRSSPYPANAIVATDTACIVSIPRNLVLETISRSPALAVSVACSTHKKLEMLHDKIEILGAGAVEARLATALLKLHAEFGDELEDGTSFIPVALSRRELAELVSTSFETAIRIMSRWEHEGVLTTHDRGFTLFKIATLERVGGVAQSHAAEVVSTPWHSQ